MTEQRGCGHVYLPSDVGGVELSTAWCGGCAHALLQLAKKTYRGVGYSHDVDLHLNELPEYAAEELLGKR